MIAREVQKAGAGIRSLAEPFLDTTSDFAEIVLAILGVAAKLERRRILERTAQGRADAKAKGVKFGRKPTIMVRRAVPARPQGMSEDHPKPVAARKPRKPDADANLKEIGGSNAIAFNGVLANSVIDTLWRSPGLPEDIKQNRQTAAIAALMAFKPRDEIEGMIAAQAVAMHCAAMKCFRRAMHSEQPAEIANRLRKDGASLARGMTEMVAALERKRGNTGNQVVRVEHVTVQAGGQAIVGAVTPAVPGGGVTDGARQEPHATPAGLAHDAAQGASGAALWRAHPERAAVPLPRNGER